MWRGGLQRTLYKLERGLSGAPKLDAHERAVTAIGRELRKSRSKQRFQDNYG